MAKPIYKYSASTDYFNQVFRENGHIANHTKKMGYKSPRLIEMVCQGARLPSSDFLFRFKNYKNLSDQDFLYLNLLVRRDRERKKGKLDSQLDAEISAFSKMAMNHELLDEHTFRMVADWQYFVLKQYFRIPRKETLEKLRQSFRNKLTEAELKKSLLTLQNLGIIFYDSEKKEYIPRKTVGLVSSSQIPSAAIRSHHKQMLQRAQEAIDEVEVMDREFLSITFTFNKKNTEKIKKDLREFRDQMEAKYLEAKGEKVYQLGIQFFPHTE